MNDLTTMLRKRYIRKILAVTRVDECTKADTGVGALGHTKTAVLGLLYAERISMICSATLTYPPVGRMGGSI